MLGINLTGLTKLLFGLTNLTFEQVFKPREYLWPN